MGYCCVSGIGVHLLWGPGPTLPPRETIEPLAFWETKRCPCCQGRDHAWWALGGGGCQDRAYPGDPPYFPGILAAVVVNLKLLQVLTAYPQPPSSLLYEQMLTYTK